METNVWQASIFQKFLQLTISGARIHWCFRMQRFMEEPDGAGAFLVGTQKFRCTGWKDDGPGAGIGLGVACHQSPARFPVQGVADTQGIFSSIEVAPHEAADFPQPQAGSQLGVVEVVPDRILRRCFQKSVHLIFVQDFHRLMHDLWWVYLFGGVDGHQPLLYRYLERMVEGSVDAVDGCRGESWALPGTGAYPAMLL